MRYVHGSLNHESGLCDSWLIDKSACMSVDHDAFGCVHNCSKSTEECQPHGCLQAGIIPRMPEALDDKYLP